MATIYQRMQHLTPVILWLNKAKNNCSMSLQILGIGPYSAGSNLFICVFIAPKNKKSSQIGILTYLIIVLIMKKDFRFFNRHFFQFWANMSFWIFQHIFVTTMSKLQKIDLFCQNSPYWAYCQNLNYQITSLRPIQFIKKSSLHLWLPFHVNSHL